MKAIQLFLKLLLDKIISFSILLIASPLILLISVVLLFQIGNPIIFAQTRPGKNNSLFTCYKFRSMTNQKDENGKLLPDHLRLTSFGSFLRSTSLDELPQLWNVLKGDMSFVGPRPLLVSYLERYSPEQARRHEVTPGITGWAQVNGRNAITWEEKFKYDVWYVDNWSLWLDLKILFLTVSKVLKREGISQSSHVTMEEFKGSSDE